MIKTKYKNFNKILNQSVEIANIIFLIKYNILYSINKVNLALSKKYKNKN